MKWRVALLSDILTVIMGLPQHVPLTRTSGQIRLATMSPANSPYVDVRTVAAAERVTAGFFYAVSQGHSRK